MRSLLPLAVICSVASGYTWKNVKIGGGGGFIPGIIFHPTVQGVAYARADIGGLYRLNSDDSWTPLEDWANDSNWHDWGVTGIGLDANDGSKVYISVGMYSNSWDPNNGSILRSSDHGTTWSETKLPFKLPGNQAGRGVGERLVVDPANSNIIYFAAPSGNGLWKSTDQGVTFSKVASFTAVGNYAEDPTDSTGYNSDLTGLTSLVFDTTSGTTGGATSRIFIGTAYVNASSLYVSNDAGATWSAVAGQQIGYFPKRMKFSAAEKALYITYNNVAGPYDAGNGNVYRYATNGTWTNITPAWEAANSLTFGYGGLALDAKNPGTLMVASDNLWYPDLQIFRSTNSGASWTTIWDYNNPHYTYNTNKAPWINNSRQPTDTKILGWMVASLEIDPFDSDHWLYGTGETLYGGHDLTKFPNVLVQSLADGIEEESVQSLISPPGGAPLLSGVGDDCGFRHVDLDVSPNNTFQNPYYSTSPDLDYAGLKPLNIVRIGNSNSDGVAQMALSTDGGISFSPATVSSTSIAGGQVAYGADGVNIVWVSASGTYRFSNGVQSTISLSSSVKLASDKVNGNYFYAADQNDVYVSSDGGATWPVSTSLANYGVNAVAVHPTVAGDVWVSTSNGLWHSTTFGKNFTKIAAVTSSYAIALGKGAGSYPNVYAFASTTGSTTLQVSADMGATWTVISDSGHGFGASSANCLAASMDTTGLVFVGTNGRGIFYGLPGGSTGSSPSSSSVAPTSTSSTSKPATSSSTSKPSTTSTVASSSIVKPTTSPPSTMVTKTSSSTSKTVTSSAPTAMATHWGQCGGMGYTGPTVCATPWTCQYSNPWYSQCL